MLENAIKECPVKIWGERADFREFWYIAFHTIFFLDYYLSESSKGFAPPAPFTLSELDPAGAFPERGYSKDELLRYLEHGRDKLSASLDALIEEKAHKRCGFARPEITVAELYLYNMRHVQHHAAQLNLMLRQQADFSPKWISTAKSELSEE